MILFFKFISSWSDHAYSSYAVSNYLCVCIDNCKLNSKISVRLHIHISYDDTSKSCFCKLLDILDMEMKMHRPHHLQFLLQHIHGNAASGNCCIQHHNLDNIEILHLKQKIWDVRYMHLGLNINFIQHKTNDDYKYNFMIYVHGNDDEPTTQLYNKWRNVSLTIMLN